MAAAAALGPAHQIEEQAPLVLDHLGARGVAAAARLEQAPAQGQVAGRVEQQAEGLSAVAPGPAHLLVVGLDRPGRGEVDDRAHVGAVDAHAEGVRGHDHLEPALREGALHARAGLAGHARVVAVGAPAACGEPGGLFFRRPARGRVDDGGPARGAGRPERLFELHVHLLRALALGGHVPRAQRQVRAGEALQQLRRVGAEAEPDQDLVAHDRRSGRGAGQHEAWTELGDEAADRQVVGAEVVAPLADAVGLVDRDERRPELEHQGPEARVGEPLRRDVGELEGAGPKPREPLAHLLRGERRGEEGGRDAARRERLHLVVHQRHERRDHQAGAGQQAGRELVGEALAAAGGGHLQQPALFEQRFDRLALPRPEALVAQPRQPGVEIQISHGPDHKGRRGQGRSAGVRF